MKKYKVALVPGDGIGKEVIEAVRQVLEETEKVLGGFALEFSEHQAGKSAYDSFGTPLPDSTLQAIKESNAAIMGAMSTGLVPPPSPMGQLRKELELYADVRPIKAFSGVWSLKPDIDIVSIRENTEGFLADRNLYKGYGEFMPTEDVVMSVRILTRKSCERIARYAFEFARAQGRKKITVAHKANVLRYGCSFFLDIVKQVALDYPEIELQDEYVDSVANNLIASPQNYDVLLTTNMFGDIISDEAAALVSSLVPTANIGPEAAVFRPIHEAKLKEAGQNITNPLPTILCGSMMLRYLSEFTAAEAIDSAVASVLKEGNIRTRDLGGKNSTTEVTAEICRKIRGQ
ncbi:MAG TPA: isocitrate/isopropylmalate dehydrogenase family protein [Desulfosporosinus sp.]|nr:isocitrate/isopropylmalate dehydrogenase family protein [Desulfosporosinus sp.]